MLVGEPMSYQIELYVTESGKYHYFEALSTLNDKKAESKIEQAMAKLRLGNLGNTKSLKSRIYEFKINSGPGYRIYFAFTPGNKIIVFLVGTKRTQPRDISKTLEYWSNYKIRMYS